jgi:hypothetical protein
VSLTGKPLVIALVSTALVGVLAGSFASGWRKARGLPPLQCGTDAGVRLEVDAGTSERQECSAAVEHWTVVHVPGPIRYVPADGGLAPQPEVVTVLVPELRLGAQQALRTDMAVSTEATATATAVAAPAAKESVWELGPTVLYGIGKHDLLVGAQGGLNLGPLGVRVTAVGNTGDVYAGGALVWRF